MPRLFGTDGVRGLANREITANLALSLGDAAARVLTKDSPAGRRPRAVIARDPRASGELLSQAMAAGLASAGVDVQHVNVLPTPGLAYLTATQDVDLGVVISASHNPMPDNGIKFFARGGYKLEDALEDDIEALLGKSWARPVGAGVGRITDTTSVADAQYIDHLVSSIETPLEGLTIVADCANGATSAVAPEALRRAGAEVVVINASPDGYNINDRCGSTHPEQLQAAVVNAGANFGVAFDGDADRCLAVDATGTMVDGDQIMGLLAVSLKEQGRLAHNTLVVTIMSNLGLKLAMRAHGIDTVQTTVGDRYVLEAMREGGFSIGGEQSGHVIALDHATTGDGTLTALLVAQEVERSGKPLAELASVVRRLPQTLINVPNVDKDRATTDPELGDAVARAEDHLGETGRVVLRPSGTEPLVRVMVEAATQQEADDVASSLAKVVAERLALPTEDE
ncbi:MAG: phosphoglucosamine mutase [Ancrocorticia sp.]|jgi:phosphoglucosamine mutase|nr:phosphoglucosamine mutase [Ancrocorticia sp.]MCI1896437.1 phosphoglucosamine mutase [Ancrocorticia sp.]MCI1933305.1 phosphoglucosamine mutase [Ancrocorticia sp.]MCI1964000.1 phosphoglucosamine mutase [Ancrocorticia sp.]MCI2001684.1 phosphoglucosamine mutase [Ancrocorticia sp.]